MMGEPGVPVFPRKNRHLRSCSILAGDATPIGKAPVTPFDRVMTISHLMVQGSPVGVGPIQTVARCLERHGMLTVRVGNGASARTRREPVPILVKAGYNRVRPIGKNGLFRRDLSRRVRGLAGFQ